MKKGIQHTGIIEKIERSVVYVRIVQQSACSACYAKSRCPASESSHKIIEVAGCQDENFFVNEKVYVCASTSQGMKAVVLAFVIPLICIVISLGLSSLANVNEIVAGAIGLAVLIPYYAIIRLMHNRLKKKFVFTLSKIK